MDDQITRAGDETDDDDRAVPEAVEEDSSPDALIANLRAKQKEVADVFGKTKVLEVPGYEGSIAIEYQYVNSETTEEIARRVRRETRNINGRGSSLLSSIDTLIAASKRVLIRPKESAGLWVDPESGDLMPGVRQLPGPNGDQRPISFRGLQLSQVLGYRAGDTREVVLGLFGSEHGIIEQNVILSRWLADKSRTMDEDFLG